MYQQEPASTRTCINKYLHQQEPVSTRTCINKNLHQQESLSIGQRNSTQKYRFRELIPKNVIPLPRYLFRSPETPPKFVVVYEVEKCHFGPRPFGPWEIFWFFLGKEYIGANDITKMCRIVTLVGVEHIRKTLSLFFFKISTTPYFFPRTWENFEISENSDYASHVGYVTKARDSKNQEIRNHKQSTW